MVKMFVIRGYNEVEIWDFIFGMCVGFYVDIDFRVRGSYFEFVGILIFFLNLILVMVDGFIFMI